MVGHRKSQPKDHQHQPHGYVWLARSAREASDRLGVESAGAKPAPDSRIRKPILQSSESEDG
ncbi:hypothetical protein P7K49_018620, partial [Saguinus oedipus]